MDKNKIDISKDLKELQDTIADIKESAENGTTPDEGFVEKDKNWVDSNTPAVERRKSIYRIQGSTLTIQSSEEAEIWVKLVSDFYSSYNGKTLTESVHAADEVLLAFRARRSG